MMIALPNEDGSFTCTLFMPSSDHEYAFDKLKTKDDVNHFFKEVFPDFYEMMPEIGDTWEDYPLAGLVIIRCFPWSFGKVSLIGDSAHATVPFYGQGMNSGFHDARPGTNIKHYLNSWHNCQAVGKVNGELVTTSMVIWKGKNWILTSSGSYYKFTNKQ